MFENLSITCSYICTVYFVFGDPNTNSASRVFVTYTCCINKFEFQLINQSVNVKTLEFNSVKLISHCGHFHHSVFT